MQAALDRPRGRRSAGADEPPPGPQAPGVEGSQYPPLDTHDAMASPATGMRAAGRARVSLRVHRTTDWEALPECMRGNMIRITRERHKLESDEASEALLRGQGDMVYAVAGQPLPNGARRQVRALSL